MDGVLSTKREETVSAADANRRFSELLRGVREQGKTFVVTSHGTPVARLAPITEGEIAAEKARLEQARKALFDRLRTQERTVVGPWTREELYDDEEPS